MRFAMLGAMYFEFFNPNNYGVRSTRLLSHGGFHLSS